MSRNSHHGVTTDCSWKQVHCCVSGLSNQMGWGLPYLSSDSETIAQLLVDHIICRHRVPEELISDQGANLLSSVNQDIWGPQAENFNWTLHGRIAKYCEKFGSDWDEYLQWLLFAYWTKSHMRVPGSPKTEEINMNERDRIMVYIPHETKGKHQNITWLFFGLYNIFKKYPNRVTVQPIEQP